MYNFQKDVRDLIPKIKIPFIVGGSGLYIKTSLFDYELFSEDEFLNHKINIDNLEIQQILEIIRKKDPKLIIR
ncbi:hypothetical protein [Candidatus Phytoplasma rubi]|uniref:hypothetical protein n=1 Tax=Candidatus Phytoplasma rubi TaxID=399025 RepID=UPI003B969B36